MLSLANLVDTIIEGDCLQILTAIPEKSVDLIFADPPYNLQLEKELWRPNATKVNGVDESWDQFADFQSYDQFTYKWLSGCKAVLKDTGTIWVIGSYHNIFRLGRIMQDLGFWILNDIVWIKNNPMPNFHGVRFTNAHETLIWAQKSKGGKYTFNYRAMKAINHGADGKDGVQMRSDWRLPICTGLERLKVNGEKAHPTQKPEALLERVIASSTNPGDIVLDPFFGTGTTGVAAKKLGRHWIGIEMNPKYISLAQERLDSITWEQSSNCMPDIENSQHRKRIPFKSILHHGYLATGQTLYLENQDDLQAVILKDGQLQHEELIGSIHRVAKDILKAPCNGWMAWYYIDSGTGSRLPIDDLRKKLRREMVQGLEITSK